MISSEMPKPSNAARMPRNAIFQLVQNIMIAAPISREMLSTIVESDWFSIWPTVSTSFVTSESVSPVLCESKYRSGRRLIFFEISDRMDLVILWATVAMMKPSA